jgi:hypothetical protein
MSSLPTSSIVLLNVQVGSGKWNGKSLQFYESQQAKQAYLEGHIGVGTFGVDLRLLASVPFLGTTGAFADTVYDDLRGDFSLASLKFLETTGAFAAVVGDDLPGDFPSHGIEILSSDSCRPVFGDFLASCLACRCSLGYSCAGLFLEGRFLDSRVALLFNASARFWLSSFIAGSKVPSLLVTSSTWYSCKGLFSVSARALSVDATE